MAIELTQQDVTSLTVYKAAAGGSGGMLLTLQSINMWGPSGILTAIHEELVQQGIFFQLGLNNIVDALTAGPTAAEQLAKADVKEEKPKEKLGLTKKFADMLDSMEKAFSGLSTTKK